MEMDNNVMYLNFEYVNLVSYCHFASQTWSTKVIKVDFTALNQLTQLQRQMIDSIDQHNFRQLDSNVKQSTRIDRLIDFRVYLLAVAARDEQIRFDNLQLV